MSIIHRFGLRLGGRDTEVSDKSEGDREGSVPTTGPGKGIIISGKTREVFDLNLRGSLRPWFTVPRLEYQKRKRIT